MLSSRGSPPSGVPVGVPGAEVGVAVGVGVGVGVGVAVGELVAVGVGVAVAQGFPVPGRLSGHRDVAGAEAVVGAVVVVPDAAAVVEHDL
nr:hypothetical protein GCM10020092_041580 [Actinoplanes digitatis]